jgi:hypothetical protein
MKPAIVNMDLYRHATNSFKLIWMGGGVPVDLTGFNARLDFWVGQNLSTQTTFTANSFTNPELFELTDQGEITVHIPAYTVDTIVEVNTDLCMEQNYSLNLLEPGMLIEDDGFRFCYGRAKVNP